MQPVNLFFLLYLFFSIYYNNAVLFFCRNASCGFPLMNQGNFSRSLSHELAVPLCLLHRRDFSVQLLSAKSPPFSHSPFNSAKKKKDLLKLHFRSFYSSCTLLSRWESIKTHPEFFGKFQSKIFILSPFLFKGGELQLLVIFSTKLLHVGEPPFAGIQKTRT